MMLMPNNITKPLVFSPLPILTSIPKKNPLVFLIGLHGVGKTTVGQAMMKRGFHHISLGDLGRMLRKHKLPKGYSLRFLRLLAGHTPGERLSEELVGALFHEINDKNRLYPVVVDGFPAEPYHVISLQPGSHLVELTCHEEERVRRLSQRSIETQRQWLPNIVSRRDNQLRAVMEVSMERDEIFSHTIPCGECSAEIVALAIINKAK